MNDSDKNTTPWLFEITPKNTFFSLNLKEVWQYRDLLLLFVKRDVVTMYKQTVLGPLWYLIQPLLTSVIFTLIFNNLAGISTGNVPPLLFNLAGIMVWNYFTSCLNDTSDTFKRNASVFGKVYFPRIIVPLSIVVSNLIKLGIQFLLFIVFYTYFAYHGMNVQITATFLLFPFAIVDVFICCYVSYGIIKRKTTFFWMVNRIQSFSLYYRNIALYIITGRKCFRIWTNLYRW